MNGRARTSYGGGDELPTPLDPRVDPAPGESRPDRPAPLQEGDLSIDTGADRAPDRTPPPNARPIRVVVGHATPVIRCGICAILAAAADIEVVGQAASGPELQHLVQKEAPDVLVVDAEMKGISSGAMLRQLCTGNPALPVLVVIDHVAEETISGLVQAGVAGCLLVDEPAERIIAAVRSVGRGERGWFSRPVAEALARRVAGITEERSRDTGERGERSGERSDGEPEGSLTPRELGVLRELARGGTNAEIARELGISERTVAFHMENLLQKLEVDNRTKAVVEGIRRGWLRVSPQRGVMH